MPNIASLHPMSRLADRHGWIAATSMVALLTITSAGRAAATPELAERSCQAADAAAFSHCVDRASRGEVDRIVVISMIQCGRDLPCGYVLRGIARPFAIIGGVAGAGFSRPADSPAGFGLRIEESSGPIIVRGLQFDLGRSAAQGRPGEIWTDPACPTRHSCPSEAIAIVESANVLVDQVQIIDAKLFGIAIVGSSSVTIRRSTFVRSGLHGIWVAWAPASRGLHIENNQFIDIRSNAAMLDGLPSDASDPLGMNTVTGNLFEHNHNAAVYHVCGPSGHEPCAGGQLDIEQKSDSFLVADNEFRCGLLDEDPLLARDFRVAGVEVAPVDIRSVIIRHNYFHDLSAGAITIDSPAVAPQLRVIDNTFERVGGRDPVISEASGLGENHGNCEGTAASCGWAPPTGRLIWAPCGSKDAQKCGTIIRWQGQNVASPMRVIVDGQRVFAQSGPAGGERIASSIGAMPTRFDLYAGATLLDTIELRADRVFRMRGQE